MDISKQGGEEMPRSPGHILIVDDEPMVVYTLKSILEHVGYRTSEAENLDQAIAVLQSDRVQAMICDLGLKGGASGVTVIERAREVQPNLSCILLTGYADPEIVDSLEARGIPVLFKPIEMGRLLAQIHAVVRERAA